MTMDDVNDIFSIRSIAKGGKTSLEQAATDYGFPLNNWKHDKLFPPMHIYGGTINCKAQLGKTELRQNRQLKRGSYGFFFSKI